MATRGKNDERRPVNTEAVWELLGAQVDGLIEAWELGDPPHLADFVPDLPVQYQRLVLTELIKVDLEYRWCRRGEPKRLEQYAAEFPVLGPVARLPCDLIYEEWQVRKQAGEELDPQEYFSRFPDQSPELIALMGLNTPFVTTTRFSREQLEAIEVGQRLDDFDLLTRLGRGAFATVFLARQISMQRLVALKVSANKSHEPQTLAQLDHPHIVRVYDQRLLPERKLRLLYMQYVAGGTLQSVVDAVRRCPPGERTGALLVGTIDRHLDDRGETPPADSRTRRNLQQASWGEAICWLGARLASALHYAHQRGVLHRDVKPANVLLAADGTPKLVDFNICFNSKLEGVSPAAYFGGSLAYMSPEQLEACIPSHGRQPEDLDGRSDVYALGVLLWELLTGVRPFVDQMIDDDRGATLVEMAAQRRQGVPADAVAALPRNLPAGLEQVLLKCLAPHENDRYPNAGELARQLELCLRPATQQLLRPSRKNWRNWMRTFPITVTGMVLAAVIPNALLSAFNIAFNVNLIVEELPATARQAFWDSLVKINSVFYAFGIGVGLAMFWPAFRAVGSLRHRPTDPETGWRVRSRTLRIGAILGSIILAEWVVSGFVFPAVLSRYLPPRATFAPSVWVEWFVSQAMYGMLAGSLAFFCITFLAVRAMYPVLLVPDTFGPRDLDPLARLSRRVWLQLALAASVPLVGLLVLGGSQLTQLTENTAISSASSDGSARKGVAAASPEGDAESNGDMDAQRRTMRRNATTLALTSLLGLVGFGVSYLLFRSILKDIPALAAAISPGGEALEGTDTTDSFWTSSPR